jgi:hypothetical protein
VYARPCCVTLVVALFPFQSIGQIFHQVFRVFNAGGKIQQGLGDTDPGPLLLGGYLIIGGLWWKVYIGGRSIWEQIFFAKLLTMITA